MKTLLAVFLLIPGLSWGKDTYLECNVGFVMSWGDTEYSKNDYSDDEKINFLVKNKSLLIDSYQNFRFTYFGEEIIDGDKGETNEEFYFKKSIKKSFEDDTSISFSQSFDLKNIGDNQDRNITYNFQFKVNKYTLETHFKEFWTNLEGENLSEDELAYMDKTNNYKLSCSKKSPLL